MKGQLLCLSLAVRKIVCYLLLAVSTSCTFVTGRKRIVLCCAEAILLHCTLQGEWTLGRSTHFGINNDYKKLFDAGIVVDPWYSIVFSGVRYAERGGTALQVAHANMYYEMERIDICKYRLRITTYDASKKRSIVSYGIIRIGDAELLISTAHDYYPKDADPKKDGGDEVRVYFKK